MLQRALAFASIGFAVACAAVSCRSPSYDTHCTPDEPDYQSREECRYTGKGNGPVVQEEACVRIPSAPPADKDCSNYTLEDRVGAGGGGTVALGLISEVFGNPDAGNCSASSCHGSPIAPAVGLYLPAGDPYAFYQSLTTFTGSVGRPYVDAADPTASWIMCNLRAQHGGGFPMPPPGGLPSKAVPNNSQGLPEYTAVDIKRHLDSIEIWLQCGANPPPENAGAGGGGGAGGGVGGSSSTTTSSTTSGAGGGGGAGGAAGGGGTGG